MHSKARAVLTLYIAEAAIQSGEVDQAVHLVRSALAESRHQPILPILHEARRIHRTVELNHGSAAAALSEDVAQFAAALTTVAAGTAS
jgi:hypothetical protein